MSGGEMWAVSPILCFIGSVGVSMSGGDGGNMAMWFGVSLGEMSGSDIAMSGGEMWAVSPIPCFIGSVASIGGGSIPLQGDSVSSVGFYGCVGGVSLLQSLAG